jgi:putative transposase
VRFLGNLASAGPKQHAQAVLVVVKWIFLQPTRETAKDAVGQAHTMLEPRFPGVAARLSAAESDVLAYPDFPVDHWRSISSTNAIERVNAELDRRGTVVGIFPKQRVTDALVHPRAPRPARRVAGRTLHFSQRPWRACCTPTVHRCSPTR